VPTYDYQCRRCGHVTEVIHSMLEEGPSACEQCGGELRRVFHPTGIIFKGGGFYKTDSRSADSTSAAGSPPPATSTPSGGDGSGAAKPSDGAGSSSASGAPPGKPTEPAAG
jgi:putative FmdB family regulatory protein